jgi:hypothetical protein
MFSKIRYLLGRILCITGRHKFREDGKICMRCLVIKEEKF